MRFVSRRAVLPLMNLNLLPSRSSRFGGSGGSEIYEIAESAWTIGAAFGSQVGQHLGST